MESLRLVDGALESQPEKSHQPYFEIPHWVRITFRVLSLTLSIIIAGLLIHTIVIHSLTKDEQFTYPKGTVFPAWPDNLKMYPTNIMLASSIIAGLLNIIALIALFDWLKEIRLSPFGSIAAISSTSFLTTIWVITVIYYKLWDTDMKNQHDVWSWTCTHKDIELRSHNKILGFGVICNEMQFTFIGGILIAVLEGINLIGLIYNAIQHRHKRSKSKVWKGFRMYTPYKPVVTVVQI